jgi:nucleoside-diphosphate-sugar epimerase
MRAELRHRSGLGRTQSIIHLAGISRDEPGNTLTDAIVASTRKVVADAIELRVRRIIYMSGYGVCASTTEPYFVAKAQAEQLLLRSRIPCSILRTSYVLGRGDEITPALVHSLEVGKVDVPGNGTYRLQPLFANDIAAALLKTAQDSRRHSSVQNVLGSPITFMRFVTMLRRRVAPHALIRRVPIEDLVRRAIRQRDPDMTLSELAILLSDRVGRPTRSFCGVRLRHLQEFIDELVANTRSHPSSSPAKNG